MKKKIGDYTIREVNTICEAHGSSCKGCIFVTDLGICMASIKYNNFYDNEVEVPE